MAAKVTSANLPSETREKAKRCLIDFLAVALGGCSTQEGKRAVVTAGRLGGIGPCTIIGEGLKTSAPFAAFANGVLGKELDMDDGHRFGGSHIAAPVMPAAIAAAELTDATGRDLIEGIVAGYEIHARIGQAIDPSHKNRGFNPVGTCGTLGAAVAASRILGLSEECIAHSIGIAANSAAGQLQFCFDTDSNTRELVAGYAAMNGLFAAILARDGFEGPSQSIEGDWGFLRAMADETNERVLTEAVGSPYKIMEVHFKPFAGCRHVHPAVTALLDILSKHELSVEDVDHITVSTYGVAAEPFRTNPNPLDKHAAIYSLPYTISVAFIDHTLPMARFTDAALKDPTIRSLMQRVSVVEAKEFSASYPLRWPCEVTVRTHSHGTISSHVDFPKGEPENPLSDEELTLKFEAVTFQTVPKERVAKIVSTILNIEEFPVSSLMRLAIAERRQVEEVLGARESPGLSV
jgi:2-methylcitrate dehydratase PrpD